MAKRRQPEKPEDNGLPRLLLPVSEAQRLINERISEGLPLLAVQIANQPELDKVRQDYHRWHDYNQDLLERFFDNRRIRDEYARSLLGASIDAPLPKRVEELRRLIQDKIEKLRSIRDRLPVLDGSFLAERDAEISNKPEQRVPPRPVTAFLSHSGESYDFLRLEKFLRALGLVTVVVEWLPYNGSTVPENVLAKARGCQLAVIFYEGKGKGMLIEMGQVQQMFGDRIIYLVKKGEAFGPMADPYAHEEFEPGNLEAAFSRIVIELVGRGYLHVTQ